MTAPAAPRNAPVVTYDFTDNGDGSFTIHDLPIVGPMKKGEKFDSAGEAPGTDRDWMERVISNHLAQLISGYVPPVHDGHHGLSEAPPLGTFVPLCVRDIPYENGTIAALCGDVTVDAATLSRIQRGELPYRSIEVARWNDAIITSLAFMSGSAPYWRFPMLRSLRALPSLTMADSAEVGTVRLQAPAAGFVKAKAAQRRRDFARLEAISTEQEKTETPKDPYAADAAGESEGKPPAKEPDGDEGGGEQGGGMGKTMGAIMQLLTRIAEAVLGGKTEDRAQPARDEDPNDSGEESGVHEDEEPKSDKGTDDSDPKEKAKMASTTTTLEADVRAQLAALTGKVTALETANATLAADNKALQEKVSKTETEAKCKAAVAEARATLRAARVVVPADFDAVAAKMHAAGDETFKSFVATLSTSGRKDPPENFTDAMSQPMTDDPALAPYAAKGAAHLEAARVKLIEYRNYRQANPSTAMTAADFLKFNVKA